MMLKKFTQVVSYIFCTQVRRHVHYQITKGDENQKYMKMTKDAILEGSSQQAITEAINRRNGQGPQYLKFFLLVFLKR